MDDNRSNHSKLAEHYAEHLLAGDSSYAVSLMMLAVSGDQDIPPAAKQLINSALMRYETGKTKSIDEALGLGKWSGQTPKQRELHSKRFQVYMAVMRIRQRLDETGNPEKIDPFDEAGELLGISGSTAKDHYYAYLKQMENKRNR